MKILKWFTARRETIREILALAILNNVQLLKIHTKTDKIMGLIEDLQAEAVSLQTSVDAQQAKIAAAIKALEDQIAAGSAATPAQLQGVLDALKATQADIDSTPTA